LTRSYDVSITFRTASERGGYGSRPYMQFPVIRRGELAGLARYIVEPNFKPLYLWNG